MQRFRILSYIFKLLIVFLILISFLVIPAKSARSKGNEQPTPPEKESQSTLAPDAAQLYLQDTFNIAVDVNSEETPAIAMCDTYDKPLVVFEKNGDIYGQRLVKADGALDDSAFLISDGTGHSSYPDVACSLYYNQYLVVWDYESSGDHEVLGRLVYGQKQVGSQLLGTPLSIPQYSSNDNTKPITACNANAANCMVAYNFGTYDPGTSLLARRVRLTGSNIENEGDWFTIETEHVVDTDITWGPEDGTYALVFSYYDTSTGYMRIKDSMIHDQYQYSGSQELFEPPMFLLGTDVALFSTHHPKVAATSKPGAFTRYLIVFENDMNTWGSLSNISAVYLAGEGSFRSNDIFNVFGGYENYDQPDIAYSGGTSGITGGYFPDQYMITGLYYDGTQRSLNGRAFTGDYVSGSGPQGNALSIAETPNVTLFDIENPDLVGSLNDGKYSLAYEWTSYGGAPNSDIHGAMVFPDCFNIFTAESPDCQDCAVSAYPINCDSGKIGYGTELEVFAWETDDYNFSYWSGDASGTDRASTFVMDSDKYVTAHFVPKAQVLFDEAHFEINTIDWAQAIELSNTLPWNPDPEWVYFGRLADEMWEDFNFERNIDQELTITLLDNYNVLILSVPWEALSGSEVAAIIQHVQNGGGLIMLGDSGFDNSTLNGLDLYYGFRFDPHGIFYLDINNPSQVGDFQVTFFADQPPVEYLATWGLNWGQNLATFGPATPLAFTDANTWQDSNDNGVYDPGNDLTGMFTVISSYDQGCGRVLAISDNSFQDGGFDWFHGDDLMHAALTWMLGGQFCPSLEYLLYIPIVITLP